MCVLGPKKKITAKSHWGVASFNSIYWATLAMPWGCARKQSISETSASPHAKQEEQRAAGNAEHDWCLRTRSQPALCQDACLGSSAWSSPWYSTPQQLWSLLPWRWGHPSKAPASWLKTAMHWNIISVVRHHFKACSRALIYHSPAGIFIFKYISWGAFRCEKTEDRQSWQINLTCLITQTGKKKLIQLSTFKICPLVMEHSQLWRGEKQLGKTVTL